MRPRLQRLLFPASVFAAALLVRLLFLRFYPYSAAPDEASWISAAADLASGKGFTDNLRHPGYIAFLGTFLRLFGDYGTTAAKVAQALLGAVQTLLVYLLARELFGRETTARLSAVFMAFYPYAVFQSAPLLSEGFYSFLLTLFMALLYLLPARAGRPALAAAAGAVFGLAALTKSTVLAAAPFILLWFALNRLLWKPALFFCLGAAFCVLPWTARNYVVFGKLVPVAMSGSYLFQANNQETLGIELATRRLEEVRWYTPEYLKIAELPPVEADREFVRRSLAFMRENPRTLLTLMKMRFAHFWRLYPITESRLQRLAALLTSGILIPLSFLGLLLSAPAWRRAFLPWAVVLAFNLAHLFFICTLRYRLPLDPFFLPFAAFAIQTLYERLAGPAARRPDREQFI